MIAGLMQKYFVRRASAARTGMGKTGLASTHGMEPETFRCTVVAG
jgi:hypothetical protein